MGSPQAFPKNKISFEALKFSCKEITIAQGNLAPLSMCFQLRNLEINGCTGVRRLCCALLLKSDKTEREELYFLWNLGWDGEKTVCDENDLRLLDRLIKKASRSKDMMWKDLDEHAVNGKADREFPPTVVCDVNERGQGFASCVYDSSGLQSGEYHISVLAVCLDKDRQCWIVPLREQPSITIRAL
ncbi:hypothetical protein L7F22_022790 [Adiantum nelumboides]|nr:hypothetical protein [Adiantum nelumboides]